MLKVLKSLAKQEGSQKPSRCAGEACEEGEKAADVAVTGREQGENRSKRRQTQGVNVTALNS